MGDCLSFGSLKLHQPLPRLMEMAYVTQTSFVNSLCSVPIGQWFLQGLVDIMVVTSTHGTHSDSVSC